MKTIAHISDIHFGREDPKVAEALVTDLRQMEPDLLINSGDFTQRARRTQYRKAEKFMNRLPKPQICVPGNHDIPLYDVVRRFFSPLKYYQNYITEDLFPLYQNDELVVLGINTARSLTWKNGRISIDQVEEMERILSAVPNNVFKAVVTHHPFIPPPGQEDTGLEMVGRATRALKVIDRCGVDLLLSGHLHHGYTGDIHTYYPSTKRSIIVAQAGTAISKRIRNEPNGYNFIRLKSGYIEIEAKRWNDSEFVKDDRIIFNLKNGKWIPEQNGVEQKQQEL